MNGKKVFAGAVFDLDGLLIDSEPMWIWAQELTLGEFGARLTMDMQVQTTGLRFEESLEQWRAWFPEAKLDGPAIKSRLLELMIAEIRKRGVAKAGALNALSLCREAGCRMAIASSSSLPLIEAALERLGARDFFEAVVSADGEAQGKPHPAVYLKAAATLRVAPEDCIAFEDSWNGLRAALAAGMHCVAVPEGENLVDPKFDIAHRRLVSLEEFRPEFLYR